MMIGIGIVLVITVIFSRIGFRILRLLGGRNESSSVLKEIGGIEQFIYSTALGFIVLVSIVFILGLLGYLYSVVLWGIVALLGILTFRDSRHLIVQIWRYCLQWLFSSYTSFEKVLLICLSLFTLVYLFVALSPPVFGYGIHTYLPTAQIYIRSHQIHFIPYVFALRPQNMAMLYTAGLLLYENIPPSLFNYLISLLLIMLLYTTAKRYISREYALLAVAILDTMPLIGLISGTISSEVGVVFYGFAAFCVFLYWWDTLKIQWIVLAGIFSGFCMGFKAIGGEIPLVIGFLILCRGWKFLHRGLARFYRPTKRTAYGDVLPLSTLLLALVIFVVTSTVAGSPWYGLVYKWIGTPIYGAGGRTPDQLFDRYIAQNAPLIGIEGSKTDSGTKHSVRSTNSPSDIQSSKTGANQTEKHSIFSEISGLSRIYVRFIDLLFRRGPIEILKSSWQMSMIQDIQGDVISPLYLAFIPLILLFPSRNKKLYLFILFGIIYFILGVNLLGRYNRYIIPIFPVLSMATVQIIQNIRSHHKRLGLLCKIVAFFMCLLYVPAVIHSGINHFPHALGIADRDAYLDRHFPGSYAVAQYVNNNLPESAKLLLVGEYRLSLFEREYVVGVPWGLLIRYQDFRDPENAYRKLQLLDVTHVILNKQLNNDKCTLCGGTNSGYSDKENYIENFENKYLQDLYQKSDVFLYVIKKDVDVF